MNTEKQRISENILKSYGVIEQDEIVKGRGKTKRIGELDKAGRNVKTSDGWKPVKTHGHLFGHKVGDKPRIKNPDTKQVSSFKQGNIVKYIVPGTTNEMKIGAITGFESTSTEDFAIIGGRTISFSHLSKIENPNASIMAVASQSEDLSVMPITSIASMFQGRELMKIGHLPFGQSVSATSKDGKEYEIKFESGALRPEGQAKDTRMFSVEEVTDSKLKDRAIVHYMDGSKSVITLKGEGKVEIQKHAIEAGKKVYSFRRLKEHEVQSHIDEHGEFINKK